MCTSEGPLGVEGKGVWGQNNSNSGPTLLFPTCVIMDKLLNLSEPQSPLSDKGVINEAYLLSLLQIINDTQVA